MAKKGTKESFSSVGGISMGCCKVEAVLGVDERGQMVLPKELREKAGIHAGDKLAVVTMARGDEICCITLIKVEELTDMVKGILGPVMKEITNS